ncbi:MAG: DUF2269 domain-containing protein [Chloroflexi bacterium]|nr:DUF2269 domain-containing protein [Chloroflexota bacterium]
MYQLLLFVHIVAAVVWVGGALYAQLLALRAVRDRDPSVLPRLARDVEFIGSRVFMPSALLLFAAGAVMTVQAWSFGQFWIAASIALWILSALAGAVYLAPRARRVAALFDAEGPSSPAGRALLGRMFLVSRLELVSFAVIIALMVFKPGS